jgi:hypothetical protein
LAAQVRLGHHQRRAQQQVIADLGRQHRRLAAPAQHHQGLVAQHAQAALGLVQRLLGRVAALGRAGIVVDPGAQEHEAVAFQPVEEGQALVTLAFGDRGLGGAQFVDRAADQGLHGVEVVDRQLDIGQRLADGPDQGGLAVLAHWGQVDLDHRAPPDGRVDHRVEHGPHREAVLRDGAHDAVDQERAVRLDDLQQIALQVGPVGPAGGTDADGQRIRRGLAEVPELGEGVGDVRRVETRQFLGRPVLLDLGGELGLRRRQGPPPQGRAEG